MKQKLSHNKIFLSSIGMGFVVLVVILVMCIYWIRHETERLAEFNAHSLILSTPHVKSLKKDSNISRQKFKEIVRKTRLEPGRSFFESIFFGDGEEIARYKEKDGQIYDYSGYIPDGLVKFSDASSETYGIEYYKKGEKHGEAKTYYKNDRLKEEAHYRRGKLIESAEFYHDGIVRMKRNYEKLLGSEYRGNKESGIGKVYARDGKLKFEWQMLGGDYENFKKSYNSNGVLVAAVYYDKDGRIIEEK